MPEHPNAKVFRDGLAAMMQDDGSVADFVADDVVWWQIGSDEPIRGREAVVAAMAPTMDMEGVEFEVDLHDVTASDDHAIGLVEATVRVGGDEFKYRTAEIVHVVDGKMTERWAFSDDTEAIIRFFARFENG